MQRLGQLRLGERGAGRAGQVEQARLDLPPERARSGSAACVRLPLRLVPALAGAGPLLPWQAPSSRIVGSDERLELLASRVGLAESSGDPDQLFAVLEEHQRRQALDSELPVVSAFSSASNLDDGEVVHAGRDVVEDRGESSRPAPRGGEVDEHRACPPRRCAGRRRRRH